MVEERIGRVEHYYPKAMAAVIHVDRGELRIGDTIHITGHGVDVREPVVSLQRDHEPVWAAHEGEDVGVLLEMPVPPKADVYLVHPAVHPSSGRDEVWDPAY